MARDQPLLPFDGLDRESARRSLDELFTVARQYRTTADFQKLLDFVARFKRYSLINAFLVYTQMPGARFVAPAGRWGRDYGRRIKTNARSLVMLRPGGPVMFVYDVSDTEPDKGARPLPPEVERPFAATGRTPTYELGKTIENARRDGVSVLERSAGSQSAGALCRVERDRSREVLTWGAQQVPLRYELLLNAQHKEAEKYATLAHELGHLYLGHLGTPDSTWWPDRRGLPEETREFEAESVSYLVCQRQGIASPSDKYLACYTRDHAETPDISFDGVVRTATLVLEMATRDLKPRGRKERR